MSGNPENVTFRTHANKPAFAVAAANDPVLFIISLVSGRRAAPRVTESAFVVER